MRTSSSERTTQGRGRLAGSRPARGGATRDRVRALAPALLLAAVVVGAAAQAMGGSPSGTASDAAAPRVGNALVTNWEARGQGQRVLGGQREPGLPTIQRQRHDDVVFTVTIAPARPGPNLVRVDVTKLDGAAHDHANKPVYVGTTADDQQHRLDLADTRPGTDGRWAVVDLPEGSGTVLVTHGRWHRIPFAVDTGTTAQAGPDEAAAEAVWTGADGPECLSAATAGILAGGAPAADCPSAGLDDADRTALLDSVGYLAGRGVTELAVQHDESARSRQALEVVQDAAADAGVSVVEPSQAPGQRNALLVVSGWDDAAASLTEQTRLPLQQQAIRSDGTWLAPWLLTPGVVDSTAGAMLPLGFDIRAGAAQEYSQALTSVLQGQAPTASGFAAWRAQRGGADAVGSTGAASTTFYAASRAAYMPAQAGHESHETQISWFPGGTVTPVATSGTGTTSRTSSTSSSTSTSTSSTAVR